MKSAAPSMSGSPTMFDLLRSAGPRAGVACRDHQAVWFGLNAWLVVRVADTGIGGRGLLLLFP